ncbi:MAG: GHKL domain-containing protein [Flavobacteriaceae bacterium]|nr:GHKL domain-containing protein [Flavobacteriaceae bacterium]
MILLVIVASVLIVVVTIFQYKEQANDYHRERLERKENAITTSIEIELRRTTWPVTSENLDKIFKNRIYDIADINQMDVFIFDLNGKLKISSSTKFTKDTTDYDISQNMLNQIAENESHRVVKEKEDIDTNIRYQSSYSYINDGYYKPIGILHVHYLNDNNFLEQELEEFLVRLTFVYLLMLLIAIVLAYFISEYITRSIKTVSDKINQTTFEKRNEKILLEDASSEIYNLVNAYNSMVDELSESAAKLAKSEREHAWREMAKQVAHEIKNPLTPMRLTVQSFEQRFDPADPNIKVKVHEFCKSLIQQVDTMSSIASAFSSFAEMPKQRREELNVVEVVKLALDIFNEDYIHYFYDQEKLIAKLDKTQLIRVVTNLVKNAIQSIEEVENPKIEVRVKEDNGAITITVADNGKGIAVEDKNRIFEPKFTTKSSGMGLGLAMVKSIVEAYNGEISFISEINKGTVFTVSLPKK